ncbi:hypothetical protein [Chitinimonas lacunae]|uniref:Uncharacterized protein n=1 Tax=Chitinimonas lacunae TaxID=1963018 RepID=A0ABV8MXT8_9NEIS
MIERHHSLDGIELPDLPWSDELNWAPIAQNVDYGLAGALIVQVGERRAGRPITLAGDDATNYCSRAVLLQLYQLASMPGKVMVLTLADGRRFDVMWRHGEGAIEARPIEHKIVQGPDDEYNVTLRFLTV